MKFRQLAAIALASIMIPATAANAGYINSRADWNRMTDAEKSSYVVGMTDAMIVGWKDEPFSMSRARGWTECISANEISNADLIQLVETGYSDVANWTKPPLSVFVVQMTRLCRDYENAERRRLGVPEYP